MDKQYFELTKNNTLMDGIEETLEQQLLGGVSEENDKIRISVATNPVLLNLRDFIKTSGKVIPADLEIFKKYDVYILPHSVGIIKEGGFKKIKQVGYRMEFETKNQLVFDLLPQAKFIKKLGAELNLEASLGIDGSFEIPDAATQVIKEKTNIGVGGQIQAVADSSIVGNVSFSVYTNEISAIGKNSDYSEWLFNATDLPLHGSDIEMNQVLLLERGAKFIKYRCKAYVNISSFLGLNSVRRETGWIDVECEL